MCILSLLSLCLRLREKYFYHAWCYNGQPIALLCVPPSLVCSLFPLSLLVSPSSLSVSLPSLLHLYISIIPDSPEPDEGAGRAVNVFLFVRISLSTYYKTYVFKRVLLLIICHLFHFSVLYIFIKLSYILCFKSLMFIGSMLKHLMVIMTLWVVHLSK